MRLLRIRKSTFRSGRLLRRGFAAVGGLGILLVAAAAGAESGKEREERQCGTLREGVIGTLQEYTDERVPAYNTEVALLRSHESTSRGELRRLDGVIAQMEKSATSMAKLDRKLARMTQTEQQAMEISTFLHKFGNDLLEVSVKAKEIESGSESVLTDPALGVVRRASEHYGPERARDNWENAHELHGDLNDDWRRMIGHLREMKAIRKDRQAEFRSDAKTLAAQANRAADEANAAAGRYQTLRKDYLRCEGKITAAGARREEIYANWPGGRTGYRHYMDFDVHKMPHVRTTGW